MVDLAAIRARLAEECRCYVTGPADTAWFRECARCKGLPDAVAALLAEVERLREDLDAWVRAVPDPEASLALHYDGCPFKPFAELPKWEMPDDAPECTCAERHKGAYWKARWLLRGGEITLVEQERDALRARVAELEGALTQIAEGPCIRGHYGNSGYVECWCTDHAAAVLTPPLRPDAALTPDEVGA